MRLRANAKINLTLDITGKRSDGYHLLDSVMQSVSLCDKITVEKAQDISVRCSDGGICGDANIAFTAAREFFSAVGISGGADIYIEKHIPQAAGLGGGSADAAAVLTALDRLYGTRLDRGKLCKIALKIGADVPFCLFGGTKRVTGVGENLEDIRTSYGCAFVLLKYRTKLSTGDMYRKTDSAPLLPPCTGKMLRSLEDGDIFKISESLGNAFLSVCDISAESAVLERAGALGTGLSGSGPTVFGIFENADFAKAAEKRLKKAGFEAYFALPEANGLIFE